MHQREGKRKTSLLLGCCFVASRTIVMLIFIFLKTIVILPLPKVSFMILIRGMKDSIRKPQPTNSEGPRAPLVDKSIACWPVVSKALQFPHFFNLFKECLPY